MNSIFLGNKDCALRNMYFVFGIDCCKIFLFSEHTIFKIAVKFHINAIVINCYIQKTVLLSMSELTSMEVS